jgi:hypothetical protein
MSSPKHTKAKKHLSLFDGLVLNALDFFRVSVRDLQRHPKYSVIHFCAGLEIFFKARLALEHWSLVATKPESIKLVNFKTGDFISVSLDEAINRLQNVAGEGLTPEETKCFKDIREHRNRLVHFFHEAYVKKPSKGLIEQVVIEQCKAWFYLYRMLTGRWQKHFMRHKRSLDRLNRIFHKHRLFLKAKYKALEPDIGAESKHGIEYKKCSSCGFESAKLDSLGKPLFESHCRVCEAGERFLRVTCPNCDQENDVRDLSSAFCENEACEKKITLADVVSEYAPGHKLERDVCYCGDCEHYEESAIPFEDGYLCLWCLAHHVTTNECGWCGSEIAGFDYEDSMLSGCFVCEHTSPWSDM